MPANGRWDLIQHLKVNVLCLELYMQMVTILFLNPADAMKFPSLQCLSEFEKTINVIGC